MKGNTVAIMADFFFGSRRRMPPRPIPVEDPRSTWAAEPESGLRVTWFGHSTLFLECDGARILIDPMFGEYASPVTFAGRKRFHPPPVGISELPPYDAIILSHDHYDHFCRPSWRELARSSVPVVTSLGLGAKLERLIDPARIVELDWWEEYAIPGKGVRLTATPAQHFSGRGITDRNATLWSSWVIRGTDHRAFFSGDTGLTEELRTIGERFGPFDLSMIEIGAAHPAWADIHLGPVNAMRALEMVGGGPMMPIHWSTFDLALHAWDEPIETLVSLAEKSGATLITPPPGRPVEPGKPGCLTKWWRGE